MAFLIYKNNCYTVSEELLQKYHLENSSVINDFSIINDPYFDDKFIKYIHYFLWNVEFKDHSNNHFFTSIESVNQDEAKLMLETENKDIVVFLVCDYFDHRKKRKLYS